MPSVRRARVALLVASVLFLVAGACPAADRPIQYVIQISVDGMAPGPLEALLAEGRLPTFKRLQAESAWTHNARTDFDFTITLPNHTCMVTCRPVKDKVAEPAAIAGHLWMFNSDPLDKTIHMARQDYVPSTFDVAHDHGLRTCMFASKSKFALYDQSYDARSGAPDATGEDNGRDKIDEYFKSGDNVQMTDKFIEAMKANPFHYSFLHYDDTDSSGHAKGWGSPEYNAALVLVDAQLGKILKLVTTDPRFKDKTAIVISADHGGTGLNHGVNSNPLNYRIPFYVWGSGVAAGKDLYALNTATRTNPGSDRPDYTAAGRQPIRNGDGGNLALDLLGLPAIPGSLINAAQDLSTGANP